MEEAGDNDGNCEALVAIGRVVDQFLVPLKRAGVVFADIKDEFLEMLSFAVKYTSLSTTSYSSVWWRLFNSPNSGEWKRILILAELLFSLPSTNGKVEQTFSLLNTIKVDRRCSLSKESLNDLITLNAHKVDLQHFTPDQAMDIWLNATV